jgi:hypothetical protein
VSFITAWNSQQAGWHEFTDEKSRLDALEARLLRGCALLFGAFNHLGEEDKSQPTVELISTIAKARRYDRLRGKLECPAGKVPARMFRKGPDGFATHLSADN